MKTSNKILIVSGGHISIPFVKTYLQKEDFDYIIAADHGLEAADELGLPIDCILGDFDSVSKELINKYKNKEKEEGSLIIRKYNPKKDYTDTQIAIETALTLKPDEIVIIGGSGTRLDHTIANIHNLLIPLKNNIRCSLVDNYNKLYLINEPTEIYKNKSFGNYISLIPLTKQVKNVSLKGFKYPLDKVDMYLGDSVGVSNEITEEKASILFDDGILIIIETRD